MTIATKVRKATFKHIESELFDYKDTIKEIEFLRQNIMFCKESDDENIGGGRSSFISSPTERIATRLLTHKKLQQLEQIAQAIEDVYTKIPETHRQLVQLKYWTKPQLKTWDGIANELHVNRATAFRWRDTVIEAIAEVLGWR
ncbi:transcriptional regulator [Metabacillus sp. 84]|uniref:transcriptional regulator n=1 Tax=Metabacillus sp. 84 TaxID=3404705 RepID=UPI003CF8A4F4